MNRERMLWFSLILAGMAAWGEEQPVVAWDFNRLENGQAVCTVEKYAADVIKAENVSLVPGKSGSAVSIHGEYKGRQTGGLTVRNFTFDFGSPFTVEALVKFDDGISRKHHREIFSIMDTEHGPGIRLEYYYDALVFSTGNGKETSQVKTNANARRISPNAWHLLSVTYDGGKITLYCDGVASAEKEIKILPAQKTKSLSIGSYKNGLSYPLQGALDELKFHHVCKTSAQVAEQYVSIFGE